MLELFFVEVETSLAQGVDQVTHARAHNFTSLTPVESLGLNLADKRLDLGEDVRACGQAILNVVLARDLIVVSLKLLLVLGLLLDKFSFFQRQCLEGLLKDLTSVDN